MEVEYREDRAAYRRHVRGMILFVSAAVLYLPAVLLVLALLAVWLGRDAARSYTGAVYGAGFIALPLTWWLYGASHLISYRCPRCGRRLPRAVPQGHPDPNICYLCTDCRIAWYLGWRLGEKA
jgi:hypothetical protein